MVMPIPVTVIPAVFDLLSAVPAETPTLAAPPSALVVVLVIAGTALKMAGAWRFLQEGGGATYQGIALAHRTSGSHFDLASRMGETPMARLLLGMATIEANFGYGTLDVAIHDLVDLAANAPSEIPGAAWRGIPISLGTMSRRSDTSSLSMSFYGDNGAEAGSVFRTEAMVGAFGARR